MMHVIFISTIRLQNPTTTFISEHRKQLAMIDVIPFLGLDNQ